MPGGGAVYAALGAALWCARAAVVAPSGDDYPRERFHALDFSQSRRIAHTMRNWGLYEVDGSRHFLSRRDSLPWAAFSSTLEDLGTAAYRGAHLAPMPWAHVRALVDALRARGTATISVDLHDRELARVPFAEIATVLERVDVFVPSRQDADVLFPGSAPLAALRRLRDRLPGVAVLGVKCGADGAFVHAAGATDALELPPAAETVVDATGAGDAFCGALLAGYATSRDVLDAGVRAAVAASFALAAVGPWALAGARAGEAARRADALRPRVRRVAFA